MNTTTRDQQPALDHDLAEEELADVAGGNVVIGGTRLLKVAAKIISGLLHQIGL
jgi:hypothetical protein